jgi:flagellar basal-body rod modification protein FlgD
MGASPASAAALTSGFEGDATMTMTGGPAANTPNPIASAVTSAANGTATPSPVTGSSSTIAGNFNTFLQLLTTQLQNQNPLDPLDTNQFTQQLVSFASVEQQINMNTQLGALITLQHTAQSTAALGFIGQTVTVSGATTTLANSKANWTFSSPKPATATFTITNATGQTVYSTTGTVQSGQQTFDWNGLDSNGNALPAGQYTMSITAHDSNGQNVAISTQVQGVVDSVDLSQNPPTLSIGGQNYTINQIVKISRS